MALFFLLIGCSFRELSCNVKGVREEISRAICECNYEKLVSLVDNDNVNETSRKGMLPIHEAAMNADREAVQMLLARGAFLHGKEGSGKSALILAAMKGNIPVCELLLKKGADVNAQDDCGRTALMCAALKRRTEVCELLLKRKEIKMQLNDKEEGTALLYAAKGGEEKICKMLLEKGIAVNAKDKHGKSALMCAALGGNIEACRLLLENGAAAEDKTNAYGRTVLMYAARSGKSEICELVLARVSAEEVNVVDTYKGTPLMYAAMSGNKSVCELLIARSGNILARDENKQTALQHAKVDSCERKFRPLPDKEVVHEALKVDSSELVPRKDGERDNLIAFLTEQILIAGSFDSCFGDYSKLSGQVSHEFLLRNFTTISRMNRKRYNSLDLAAIGERTKPLENLLGKQKVLEYSRSFPDTKKPSSLKLAIINGKAKNAKMLIAHGAPPFCSGLLGQKLIIKPDNEYYNYVKEEALFDLLMLGRLQEAVDLLHSSFEYLNKKIEYARIIDLKARDNEGKNVYHYLAAFCDAKLIFDFFKRSFELESYCERLLYQRHSGGHSPIELAVLNANLFFIKHLAILGKLKIDTPSDKESLLNIMLSGEPDIEVILEIIKHISRKKESEKGKLHDILMGKDELDKLIELEDFVEAGGDLSAKMDDGFSILEDIITTDNESLLKYLINSCQFKGRPLNLENLLLKSVNLSSPKCLDFLYSLLKAANVDFSALSERIDLHQLCSLGELTAIKVVLNFMRAKLKSVDECGDMPIHVAARNGRIEVVKELLEHEEVTDCLDAKNACGQNPIHCAVIALSPETISLLFEKGCRALSERDNEGRRPLDLVKSLRARNMLERSKRIGVIYALLSLTSLWEYEPDNYEEAINLAIKQGEIEVVKELLRAGVTPHKDKDGDGNTSLHHAIISDNAEIVRIVMLATHDCTQLNNRGKDPLCFTKSVKVIQEYFNGAMRRDVDSRYLLNRTNEQKENILQVTIRRANEFKEDMRQLLSILKCMIDNGADRENVNDEGLSSVELATKLMGSDLGKEILNYVPNFQEMEARIDRREKERLAEKSREPIMRIRRIIEENLNPNAFLDEEKKEMALHYLIKNNNFTLIQCLLELGADPFLEDNEGKSAYRLAAGYNASIFRYLLEVMHYKDLLKVDSRGENLVQIALSKGGEAEKIILDMLDKEKLVNQKLELPGLFFTAIDYRRNEAIGRFSNLGFNMRERDPEGKSLISYAMDSAERAGHRGLYERSKFEQCFRSILAEIKNADVFGDIIFGPDNRGESSIGKALSVTNTFYLTAIMDRSRTIFDLEGTSRFTKVDFYLRLTEEISARIEDLIKRKEHLMILLACKGVVSGLSCGAESIFGKAIYLAAERKNRDAVRAMIASFVSFKSRRNIRYDKLKGYLPVVLTPLCEALRLGPVSDVICSIIKPSLQDKYEAIKFIDSIYREGEWALDIEDASLKELLQYYEVAVQNFKEPLREEIERELALMGHLGEASVAIAPERSTLRRVMGRGVSVVKSGVNTLIDKVKEELELEDRPIMTLLLEVEEPSILLERAISEYKATRQGMLVEMLELLGEYNQIHYQYSILIEQRIKPIIKGKGEWNSGVAKKVKELYGSMLEKRRKMKNRLCEYVEYSSKGYKKLEMDSLSSAA